METRIEFNGRSDGDIKFTVGADFFDGGVRTQTNEIKYIETSDDGNNTIRIGLDPSRDFEEICGDYGFVMPDESTAKDPYIEIKYASQENRDLFVGSVVRNMENSGVIATKATASARRL